MMLNLSYPGTTPAVYLSSVVVQVISTSHETSTYSWIYTHTTV